MKKHIILKFFFTITKCNTDYKMKYIPGWVKENVKAAKETKHLFKCIWCRNKSTFNTSQYMQKVYQYKIVCMQAKSEFLTAKFQDNHDNPQKLVWVLSNVLHRLPPKLLPSINPPQLLADRFVEFFKDIIEKIRSTFPASLSSQHITLDPPLPIFSTFTTVTEDQVFKEVLKNYSLVSNLIFISKILERVVVIQLQTHLDKAGLLITFQSAYRFYWKCPP